MFNWETFEPAEYSRDEKLSFVDLTKRSYVTAEGDANDHSADPNFLRLATAAAQIAKTISGGPANGIPVSGFKDYVPYPVQAVWTAQGNNEHFKIWIKQPLFIDEADFAAAMTQTDFDHFDEDEIHFEHLAEGIEIQTVNRGPLTADAPALQTLTEAIKVNGYKRLHDDQHREVYIDGLPLDEDKVVLVRLAIDPNGQELPGLVHN
jgi:hypothetical protein